MTDQDTVGTLKTLVADAKRGARQTEESINDAPNLVSLSGEMEEAKHSLQHAVDIVSRAEDALTDGDAMLDEASRDIADTRQILSMLSGHLDEIEAEDGPDYAGKLVTESTVYEVQIIEDETEGFGVWLAKQISSHSDLTLSFLERNTIVSRERLDAILDGERPRGDEAPSIVETIFEAGLISEEERDRVRERYFETDEDSATELFD